MAAPVWNPGQVLAAADVNAWFVGQYGYKAANTSRTNNSTLANDPDLAGYTLAANAVYYMDMFVAYEGDNTGKLKWQFSLPAGASMVYTAQFLTNASTWDAVAGDILNSGNTVIGPNVYGAGAGTQLPLTARGTVTAGGTGGTMAWQWAQNSVSSTATVVHTGSALVLTRIA